LSRSEPGRAPLRIALVTERFARDGGGLAHAAWEIARALIALGDTVHVIGREIDTDLGIHAHRVAVPSRLQPIRVLEFSRAARRVVETERFDAVHGFARVHVQDLFHAGVGCHADYLKAVHGGAGRMLRRLSPRHAVQLQLETRIARDPRVRIQCPSEAVARAFRTHYDVAPERLRVIPNGVDPGRFAPPAEGDDARRALRAELAPGADAVWVFVGSGFRRKGLDTAMAALARSRIDRSVLWVAGRDRADAWRRRAHRLGVGDRVRFLGERHDVEHLLAASDGLVLPTRYEPGGLSVLEAAACARPVVTSAACGHAELLGDAALVVEDANDVDGFAAALDRLADGAARRRLGRAARARVAALGWSEIARSLRDEYVRIASERKARS